MDFLHTRVHMDAGDIAVVRCTHQCNVRLMTDSDFRLFQKGAKHHYYGGWFERLPAQIAAPSTGMWNIVLDLAGGSANIQHSIAIVKG